MFSLRIGVMCVCNPWISKLPIYKFFMTQKETVHTNHRPHNYSLECMTYMGILNYSSTLPWLCIQIWAFGDFLLFLIYGWHESLCIDKFIEVWCGPRRMMSVALWISMSYELRGRGGGVYISLKQTPLVRNLTRAFKGILYLSLQNSSQYPRYLFVQN